MDPGYSNDKDKYLARARTILKKQQLEWSNVLAPKGLDDVVQTFNVSGYGNIIVDAKGIVRGVNVHGKQLERLVEEILGKNNVDKPQK